MGGTQRSGRSYYPTSAPAHSAVSAALILTLDGRKPFALASELPSDCSTVGPINPDPRMRMDSSAMLVRRSWVASYQNLFAGESVAVRRSPRD